MKKRQEDCKSHSLWITLILESCRHNVNDTVRNSEEHRQQAPDLHNFKPNTIITQREGSRHKDPLLTKKLLAIFSNGMPKGAFTTPLGKAFCIGIVDQHKQIPYPFFVLFLFIFITHLIGLFPFLLLIVFVWGLFERRWNERKT